MSSALPADPEDCILVAVAEALRAMPASASDEDAFHTAWLQASDMGLDFFERVQQSQGRTSSGLWSIYLATLVGDWKGTGVRQFAGSLLALCATYPAVGQAEDIALLDALAAVIDRLALGGTVPSDARRLKRIEPFVAPDEDDPAQALALALFDAAQVLVVRHWPERAFNFVALSLDQATGCPPVWVEQVATLGIELGLSAQKSHQTALCTVALAEAVMDQADADPALRMAAFKLCEIAIERIRLSPAPYTDLGARRLAGALVRRDYLDALRLPLALLIDSPHRPTELAQALHGQDWIPRVSRQSVLERAQELERQNAIQSWDLEIEAALEKLETAVAPASASADPITWTIEHPAHRRAIPHLRSFLRERDFDHHLVELAHEITHILSYLGHLGAAITCLRVANFDNESTLWALAYDGPASVENIHSRVSEGPAPLAVGDASQLFRAALGVELAAKARALQDIWAPWLEGLALYGETAADPATDLTRINGVAQALRGLIDFYPPEGTTAQSLPEVFDRFVREFEERCSQAMRRRGPDRLGDMLRREGEPYFAGYLGVRAVVASWRANGRPTLDGSQAFDLLLHATRFSTAQAIPDLSLPSAEFERRARAGMAAWMRGLAGVSVRTLDDFLAPVDPSDPGRICFWEGFELVWPDDPIKDGEQRQTRWLAGLLKQALKSLLTADDVSIWRGWSDDTPALAECVAEALSAHQDSVAWASELQGLEKMVQHFINAGGMLPIGRTHALFYLVHDTTSPISHLILQLRTTQALVDTGLPSTNVLWQPMSSTVAQALAEAYEQHAEPRVEVSRVIDLLGLAGLGEAHLLTFHYGDWFEVHGPLPHTDAQLQENAEMTRYLQHLLRQRLHPSAAERMLGEEFFARDASLQRTLQWLLQTDDWRLGELPLSVELWVDDIAGKASRTLNAATRRRDRTEAARLMLAALWPSDPDLVAGVVELGFESLTDAVPEMREDIVNLLLASARAPALDESLVEVACTLRSLGASILSVSSIGCDVSPATFERQP